MKCPQCNKKLKVPAYAFNNVEVYDNIVTVVTECCKKPVRISRITNFSVTPYTGNATEDDWGVKIEK